MTLRVIPKPKIPTRGPDGQSNGFLIPIFNVHDGFLGPQQLPQQVYLTVCAPGTRKGPHLHMKRWGCFTCVKGNIRVTARVGSAYVVEFSGEDHEFRAIQIPAGVPAMLENVGDIDAYVINTPSPAWHVDDQDDHPVADWAPPETR